MSHPQHQLRVFLEDGPYAGETMSVKPDPNGRPPSRLVVEGDGGGDPHEVSDHTTSAGDAPHGPATYGFDRADLDNGVWRYRLVDNNPQRNDT